MVTEKMTQHKKMSGISYNDLILGFCSQSKTSDEGNDRKNMLLTVNNCTNGQRREIDAVGNRLGVYMGNKVVRQQTWMVKGVIYRIERG